MSCDECNERQRFKLKDPIGWYPKAIPCAMCSACRNDHLTYALDALKKKKEETMEMKKFVYCGLCGEKVEEGCYCTCRLAGNRKEDRGVRYLPLTKDQFVRIAVRFTHKNSAKGGAGEDMIAVGMPQELMGEFEKLPELNSRMEDHVPYCFRKRFDGLVGCTGVPNHTRTTQPAINERCEHCPLWHNNIKKELEGDLAGLY